MSQLETSGSLQKIFNAAWQHFIVEDNPPCVNISTKRCVYLNNDGNKCAVGLCIPDGHPAQEYDGSFNGLVSKYPDLFPDLQDYDGISLSRFQKSLHDCLHDDGKWFFSKEQRKERYLAVAKDYGLTVPESKPNNKGNSFI